MTTIQPISSPQLYESSPSSKPFILDSKYQGSHSNASTSIPFLLIDPLSLFDKPFPSVHKTGSSHFPASKPSPIPRRKSFIAPPLILPTETTSKLSSFSSSETRASSSSSLSAPTLNSPKPRSPLTNLLSPLKSTNPAQKEVTRKSTITFSVSKDQSLNPLSSTPVSSVYANYLKFNEEKALRNWQRHYMTWKKTEESLSTRIHKPVSDLIMTRVQDFRKCVEERTLIEAAAMELERKSTHCSNEVPVGHDLFGLTMMLPKSGPRSIERIIYPSSSSKKCPFSIPHLHPYLKQRQQELQSSLKKLDPLFGLPFPPYLEILGRSASPIPSTASSNPSSPNPLLSSSSSSSSSSSCSPDLSSNRSESVLSMSSYDHIQLDEMRFHPTDVILSTSFLSFEAHPNEVTASALTLYNQGMTTVHFEWQSKHSSSSNVFYIHPIKGVLMPYSAFNFHIYFKANVSGAFSSTYSIVTRPHHPGLQVKLHGMCFHTDDLALRRHAFLTDLQRRVAHTTAQYILEHIFKSTWDTIAYRAQKKPKISSPQTIFISKNHPQYPVPWSPYLDYQLTQFYHQELYVHLPPEIQSQSWDHSISTLYICLAQVQDPVTRHQLYHQFNQILSSPTSSSSSSSLFCLNHYSRKSIYIYDSLVDICDQLYVLSCQLRQKLNLPLERSCLQKFSKYVHEVNDTEEHTANSEQGKGAAAVDKKLKANPVSSKEGNKLASTTSVPVSKAPNKPVTSTTTASPAPAATKVKSEDRPSSPLNTSYLSSTLSQFPSLNQSNESNWPLHRKWKEKQYLDEFKLEVSSLIVSKLARLQGYFKDMQS